MGRSVGSDTKMQARLAGSPRTGPHQTSKERVTQKRQPATNPAEVRPGEHDTMLQPRVLFLLSILVWAGGALVQFEQRTGVALAPRGRSTRPRPPDLPWFLGGEPMTRQP